MGNTIRIQEHLPESEYKKASVHLANALSTNHFKSFEELIDDDAVLVLHESRSIFGKENIIEYWKDWLSRLKKEISALVSRYFDVSADMFEVRITLKQNKKRV